MFVKVYANRLIDVINYCSDNVKHPLFLDKIIDSIGRVESITNNYVDIDLLVLEQICTWCEKENICNNLTGYDDFYYKFKRIIEDIKFEEKNMFNLK